MRDQGVESGDGTAVDGDDSGVAAGVAEGLGVRTVGDVAAVAAHQSELSAAVDGGGGKR